MINPVSTSPTTVDLRQEAAPRAQVKPAPQEQATDSVTLSAKARAGDVDGDGDGH
jgi:anti-sigma28 factor (negative regulator of flagellin synthesis)